VFDDADLIPLSALQHHLFCPRQCALIHVDGLWAEDRRTAEGRLLHERSDDPGSRVRRAGSKAAPVRTVRAMPLICRRLGLVGKADQVELPLDASGNLAGPPRPIEHKRGRPKRLDHDRVQVAAQALCLEEMFGLPVQEGELFYDAVRRREVVAIDARLRSLVERTAAEVRRSIATNTVPSVERKPKCKSCSLVNLCLPAGTGPGRSPRMYLARSLSLALAATDGSRALDAFTDAADSP
jgi:CRISPR-associated protein Cas4